MTGSTDVEQVNPVTNPQLQNRLDVQSDIDVYARAILDLKSRLNALTPIGILPPELLSDILVCGVMDDYYSCDWSSDYYYTRPHWIKLTHVCRRFRAVAHSTPRFWSFLRITESQPFAELVARSKSALLHIHASIDNSSRVDRTLALNVLQHTPRIKELRIDGHRKDVQFFCFKTVAPLDALERLVLTDLSGYLDCTTDYETQLPPVVPIVTASHPLPRLRHLELRRLPFQWNDIVFFSPNLTTLIVTGKAAWNFYGDPFPDVGTFDELFSALAVLAPRLQVLVIENALPRQGLAVTNPMQLPSPSRTIPLLSIEQMILIDQAPHIAHLLNHLSSPPTAILHVRVRNQVGNKELVHSIAARLSEGSPFLSLHISPSGPEPLTLSAWTDYGTSGEPSLRLSFESISLHFLVPVLQGMRTLFLRVQFLLIGRFSWPKWADFFSHFPSVTTMVLVQHPWDGFFSMLATPRHLQSGGVCVALAHLRVLELHGFRFSFPAYGLEPFDDLLDWAIFRCNCGLPVDEIRLNECRYATGEKVRRLEEVVVDVHWDGWEIGSTTEEESEESDSDQESEGSDSNQDPD